MVSEFKVVGVVCICVSSDVTDRVQPAGVQRAAALPGLRLAEDQVGGQPANSPHPRRLNRPQLILLSSSTSERCFIYILSFASPLPPFLQLLSPSATAREVCDERRGWSFFRRVCGDEDESSRQVPEESCRPPRPLLQPASKRLPLCQGRAVLLPRAAQFAAWLELLSRSTHSKQ